MANTHSYDLVIVGAGPAGSFAAERLAKGGSRVALFDGRPPGEPKACGGGVTAKARHKEVLAQAKGKPEHIVRLTWYVLDKQEYLNSLKAGGEAYRELMGSHYPAMALVEVKRLVDVDATVEIEATAVIP